MVAGLEGKAVPYGVVMMDDAHSSFEGQKHTFLHELGHALSIGWADDKGPGHVAECYSGEFCQEGSLVGLKVGGGNDPTPENIAGQDQVWSIMSGSQAERSAGNYLAYSIEEMSTADIEDVPSRDD